MSIFKVIRCSDDGLAHLQDRLTYIRRVEATRMDYTYGVAVSEHDPYTSMLIVKRAYGQYDGKSHFHYMLNPEENDFSNIEIEDFYETGVKLAKAISGFYGNYQVVMAIHFDCDYPHIHFIANNVDYMNGQRLNLQPQRLKELKDMVSDILVENGISPIRQWRSLPCVNDIGGT